VHVHHEIVLAGDVEDFVELRCHRRVAHPATEQETHLQRAHPGFTGQRQRLPRPVGVGGLGRDPQRRPDPVGRVRCLHDQLVERECDVWVGHAVVGDDQCPFCALGVQI
jgi:hypothetical protein